MKPVAQVVIDKRAVSRLGRGHPWVYANEILSSEPERREIPPGALVTLVSPVGEALGVAAFNRHSLIAARRLSDSPRCVIDAAFCAARLQAADALRRRLIAESDYRLAHGEADGLPGLVVDRFGDVFVLQLNTAGAEILAPVLLEAVQGLFRPRAVVLRRDAAARRREGLELAAPEVVGRLETAVVTVAESRVAFAADLLGGQKTGWYFDQRRNRGIAAGWAHGARVLDLYCHSGGFALRAAAAGAREVIGVDASAPALDLARKAARLNGLPEEKVAWREGDVRAHLRRLRAQRERFDIVIADPPPFAPSRKDLPAARKAYARLAHDAAWVTREGGLVAIASCSHHLDEQALLAACARGFNGAGRCARLIHTGGADVDHPVLPALPESRYLTMLFFALD